jgi:hypothetical protein
VDLTGAVRVAVGRLDVNHGPGPEVNGTVFAPTTALTVGTTVRVTGGAGPDFVVLGGGRVSVGGGLTIANGPGNSLTRLDPTGGLFVGGTVGVTAAAGNDTVQVGRSGGATVIGGGVRVAIGDGGGGAAITGSRLTVGREVAVTAGGGTDSATIQSEAGDGAVGGGVTVKLGAGDGQYVFVGAFAMGTVLAVGGALRVTTAADTPGPGGDRIFLTGVQVRLGTTVTTGAGADAVYIANCTFDGAFALATGGENDRVLIERQGYGGTTRFRGPVRVVTGAGDDRVDVGFGNPGIDQAVFATTNAWDGGSGTADEITIAANSDVFFGIFAVVAGFETAS